MTDDERELAEWVARWVGGEALGIDYDIWSYNLSEDEAKMLLADEALAWRALVRLLELDEGRELSLAKITRVWMPDEFAICGSHPIGWHYADTPQEAVFRALRAAKEKECD